ncbi:uncharacterized protein PHALS_05060 [Plasmopara halstedii]|uniref:Uncharacterized protein n=1 Tax=Plasmopara halstedii TaxID=4781 RepID=A0A0P1AAK5_PLAHL|nr:uncharacterized protein PHALS_05060 [Plasmopara halstedii]CEG37469.1 hypothetical protein PHALS_05060 [Plasmopara halstedii]|eukprot:XP_024573838.1 hypothetical protein PHALS_05060 [Plasmopara halstedii]
MLWNCQLHAQIILTINQSFYEGRRVVKGVDQFKLKFHRKATSAKDLTLSSATVSLTTAG